MQDLVSWLGIEPRLCCIESLESKPLDHQGIPAMTIKGREEVISASMTAGLEASGNIIWNIDLKTPPPTVLGLPLCGSWEHTALEAQPLPDVNNWSPDCLQDQQQHRPQGWGWTSEMALRPASTVALGPWNYFYSFDDRITTNRALLAFYNLIGTYFINFISISSVLVTYKAGNALWTFKTQRIQINEIKVGWVGVNNVFMHSCL